MQYYDDLAEYYGLIFADWEESMARQGAAIAAILRAHGPDRVGEPFRVLDVSAGIGTQSLPLASSGFEVTARDVSSAAIARLRREAARRGLDVDAARADMRSVRGSVIGPFDAVESSHPYGERTRNGKRFRLRQDWKWIDEWRYHTTFVVEEQADAGWNEVVRTMSPYYAIPVSSLLTLMRDAGFDARLVTEVQFYQPVLMGCRLR